MPLDIALLRSNRELVEKSQVDRYKDPKIVEQVLKLDNDWIVAIKELDNARKEARLISKEIGVINKKAVRAMIPCGVFPREFSGIFPVISRGVYREQKRERCSMTRRRHNAML